MPAAYNPYADRMRKIYLLPVLILAVLTALRADGSTKREVITPNTMDSLWRQLHLARTPKDSIEIIYNIYDVNVAQTNSRAGVENNKRLLNMLYDVSMRANDTLTAFDAVKNIATLTRFDLPLINLQLKRIAKLPDSPERQETEAFLHIQQYFSALNDTTLTDDQRRANFYQISQEVSKNRVNKSLYDRITQQFALVMYGSNLIRPEKMHQYLKSLEKYIRMTKDYRSSFKSHFYRVAANLYDENLDGRNAVIADSIMLAILREKDLENVEQKRVFKNYDVQRYNILRRVLSNYEYLPQDTISYLYQDIKDLEKRLPQGQLTMLDHMSVEAMWNMYKENYPEALKALRYVVTSRRFRDKPTYVRAYIKAAVMTGSYDDLQKGQKMFTDMLIKRARDAADTEHARLRIEYEIDTLEASSKNATWEAEIASKKSEQVESEFLKYGIAGLGIFFIVIIVVQTVANRRTRRMADHIAQTNERLKEERDRLRTIKTELEDANSRVRAASRQKSEFIHNVSHEISEPVKSLVGYSQLVVDSIPEERRKYLEGFVNIMENNARILQRIVTDILDTAEVDDVITNITLSHFKPEEICRLVAESFTPRLKEDQTIVVEPTRVKGESADTDGAVDTDASRLEQILNNVLANAVKFGEHGKITVRPEVDYGKGIFRIIVSDEGPGIPAGKEEVIFNKFEKIGHYSDGLGLGLYVSRELAHLLGGEITVDKEYRRGASFVITLPVNLNAADLNVEK